VEVINQALSLSVTRLLSSSQQQAFQFSRGVQMQFISSAMERQQWPLSMHYSLWEPVAWSHPVTCDGLFIYHQRAKENHTGRQQKLPTSDVIIFLHRHFERLLHHRTRAAIFQGNCSQFPIYWSGPFLIISQKFTKLVSGSVMAFFTIRNQYIHCSKLYAFIEMSYLSCMYHLSVVLYMQENETANIILGTM
jgi:hypothetical protein